MLKQCTVNVMFASATSQLVRVSTPARPIIFIAFIFIFTI